VYGEVATPAFAFCMMGSRSDKLYPKAMILFMDGIPHQKLGVFISSIC